MANLDRVLTIHSVVGSDLPAPEGSSWRTYGSPIGAGEYDENGRLLDGPPWVEDLDDTAVFRAWPDPPGRELALFVADDTLLDSWADMQTPPIDIHRQDARALSLEVVEATGDQLATQMVGQTLRVRGLVFSDVTAAVFVRRSETLNTHGRHGYSRFNLTLESPTPEQTYYVYDSEADRLERVTHGDAGYIWGYLDESEMVSFMDRAAWCEILDLTAIDQLSLTIDTVDSGRSQIDILVRVRSDEDIEADNEFTLDGDRYQVRTVTDEIEGGRGRFKRLAARRYE